MIGVAGIDLVHVALFDERLNHLTGHQNPRHEDAMAAALAVPALAERGECGSGVRLVNLVTSPRQVAVAHQPSGVALDTVNLQGGAQGTAEIARRGQG